jgi:hypothetical protein
VGYDSQRHMQELVIEEPSKNTDPDFSMRLELTLRRRKALLPGLVVCLALIGSSAFWRIVEKLVSGVG